MYIANRSKERFKDFLAYPTYLYKNLQDFDFDLVVNSTSAGLKDENLPCDRELLDGILPKAKFAFEVIYGRETPFYRLCKEYHLKIKDGLDMLLWQGVFAFELFLKYEIKER